MNRTKGLISIIVPVYNAKEYIKKCVDSILNQSYENIELILVDDGSYDGSSDICEQIEKEDGRVILIHSVNCGAAAARNKGLDAARGEFVMFIDADDYIEGKLCETLLYNLKVYKAECCLCGYQIVTEQKKGCCFKAETTMCFSGTMAIKQRYIECQEYVNIINPWGKIYHWTMWENLRFTEGLYYEDMDIMPYLYANCSKIVCIPYVGYYYLHRVGSCSHGVNSDGKRYVDSIIIRQKHIIFFEKAGETELALAIMKKTLELIIVSDCKGWIPESYKKESIVLFKRYWKQVLKCPYNTVKDKVRYIIYRYLGTDFYRHCIFLWQLGRNKGERGL